MKIITAMALLVSVSTSAIAQTVPDPALLKVAKSEAGSNAPLAQSIIDYCDGASMLEKCAKEQSRGFAKLHSFSKRNVESAEAATGCEFRKAPATSVDYSVTYMCAQASVPVRVSPFVNVLQQVAMGVVMVGMAAVVNNGAYVGTYTVDGVTTTCRTREGYNSSSTVCD